MFVGAYISVFTCMMQVLTCMFLPVVSWPFAQGFSIGLGWVLFGVFRDVILPRIVFMPKRTFNLPSNTKAYIVLRGLYFLMPVAVAEHAVCLIEEMRPRWMRDYGPVRTEALTFRFLARWLLNEVVYVAVHPFRLIKREIFRP